MSESTHPYPAAFRTVSRSPEEALARAGAPVLVGWLQAVQGITDAALVHQRLDSLLDEMLARVRELFEIDAVRLWLRDADGDLLRVHAAVGGNAEVAGGTPLPIGAGIAGRVAAHRRAAIVDDVGAVTPLDETLAGFRSVMVAPLLIEGTTIGALEVATPGPRRFSEAELSLLQVVADRLALVIDRVRLEEAGRAAHQEVLDQLDEERIRFEAVLQQLPTGVLIAEAPSGRLVLGSERVRQILRTDIVPFAELMTAIAWVGFRPDGTEIGPDEWPLTRALAGERVIGEEILLHRPDGSSGWIRVNAAPIRNGAGSIVAGVAVFHDVDRERRASDDMRFLADASAALHASLDYRTTARQAARLAVPRLADWCAVDLVDTRGEPVPQEFAHRDADRAEGVDRPLFRLDAPDHPIADVLRSAEAVLLHEVPDSLLELLGRRADSVDLLRDLGMHSAMVVPLVYRERVLGVMTMATARPGRHYTGEELALAQELARRSAIALENARLYEEAASADRAKSDFLAVMSHELRTPLAAIMGYAELLQMGIPDEVPDAALRQVDRIDAAARHQLQLIDQILTFSRLAANQETVDLHDVELTGLIEEAIALVRPTADRKRLGLHLSLPGERVSLRTDAAKLRQALSNLLFNSIQFTREGEVRVEVEADEADVEITLRDTGIGIAPEHREKIFEPFFQVRQSSTREVGGTGLGLTVARRLLQLLGGNISLRSELDRGTVFTVRVPRSGAGRTG
jgi:signal transduction histidine kinase/putative methionine-R-sulfoxide reductase with GAF domain